jgi:hypothetical protein
MRCRMLIPLLCSLACLAGCGVRDPYAKPEGTPTATPTAAPTIAPPEDPPRNERETLERFAQRWSNWTYPTLAQVRVALADQASGRLRQSLLADARAAAEDASLRAGNSSNRGVVEGIMLRPDKPAIVVTREQATLGTGQGQAGYFVYLARAERTRDGWRVVSWDPV